MLEVEEIHTFYGDSHVLQGVSLRVHTGRVVAVLGRNGVGKTTLVRSIIGFTPPRKGKILFNGVDITGNAAYKIARLGIGLVPQGRRIFPSLSVKENLEIARRKAAGGDLWTLEELKKLFPWLGERMDHRGSELSGGEQQMLASGRALMSGPLCLLMDEPSEGLAPLMSQKVGQLVDRIKESGVAVLLIEQNLAFALRHADEVYIMSRGKMVYQGTPQELRDNLQIKSRYLGV